MNLINMKDGSNKFMLTKVHTETSSYRKTGRDIKLSHYSS